jgi:hypothetical protein
MLVVRQIRHGATGRTAQAIGEVRGTVGSIANADVGKVDNGEGNKAGVDTGVGDAADVGMADRVETVAAEVEIAEDVTGGCD